MTQVPILTYHANNINGMDYQNNDHVALAADLKMIHELGFNIITMDELVSWHSGDASDSVVKHAVVLTCDDGTDFDYHDLDHPHCGWQRSFFNILKDHQARTGARLHMTNFVIVSPEARVTLDQKCLIGKSWWQDSWWSAAQASGLMDIANHSWDHNHGVLENNNHNDDSFRCIADKAACDQQIKQAQEFLDQHILGDYQSKYFAYPYGNHSDYLRFEYLPEFGKGLNLKAAFSTEPKHVNRDTAIWGMPRYVCNNDWHNTEQLKDILLQA